MLSLLLVMIAGGAWPAFADDDSWGSGAPSAQRSKKGTAPSRKGKKAKSTDPYAGSFSNEQVVITLEREGSGYRGNFSRLGQQARMEATLEDGALSGVIHDTDGRDYPFTATVSGDSFVLEIYGQKVALQRQSSASAGGETAKGTRGKGGGGPGSVGSGKNDQQLARVLLSSRWCHFSYSQGSTSYSSGSSYQETVTLGRDGVLTVNGGGETYSSGWGGSYAGSSRNAPNQYYWRIKDGTLHLSSDGANWTTLPMQVQVNSSGYPIFTVNGKEYSMCQ